MAQSSVQRKKVKFTSRVKNSFKTIITILQGLFNAPTVIFLLIVLMVVFIGFAIWRAVLQDYVWTMICAALALASLASFIFLVYTSKGFEWVGIKANEKIGTTIEYATSDQRYSKTIENQPGKTLWDWLQLLIIPAVLISATIFFNNAQTQNSLDASDKQQQIDRELAQDQQHENVLINYEKDISDLLSNQQQLDQQLLSGSFPPGEAVRAVARARTLTALSAFNQNSDSATIQKHDKERKKLLVQFLYDAHLIITRHPIVDLHNADLRGVDLSGTEQNRINLSRINLTGANLKDVNLNYTNLNGAYLDGDLTDTTFTGTDLSYAYLWNANLSGVDLSRTTLTRADLSGANLKNAKVDLNNLKNEARLSNTILPNQTISPANQTPTTTCTSDPGFDSTQWHNFLYNTNKKTTPLANVSESDVDEPNTGSGDKALQFSLLGGTQYTGFQAYRTLRPNKNAYTFELCLSFYLTDVTPIQALAFSIQKWANNKEWEWALQWQKIGDGTPQQGTPPNWRIWTGDSEWNDANIPQQDLSTGQWYTLDLKGNITNDQVQYGSTTFNGKDLNLPKLLNTPVTPPSYPGDKLVISIELNGDSQEDPYDVYIDNIHFTYN